MSQFELRFTAKEITPWGGMALMKRMLDRLEIDKMLSTLPLPQPGSNRGYCPKQLLMQFMLGIWCGANRFEHGEVTRHDIVLQQLFGWKKMANFKAVMRLFRKFDQGINDAVFTRWYQQLFASLTIDCVTLDVDSTVMTRYGAQEGAVRGYNPNKRGRASHHPLIAFIADTKMVANCWLRPGNTSGANHVSGFLANTLARLGNKRVGLLRADSGFAQASFLSDLTQYNIPYIIALRMTQPLQRSLASQQGWWDIDEPGAQGIELCSFMYQSHAWDKPRRVIAIRQHMGQRTARGKSLSLFAEDELIGQYRWSALVTDLNLPALDIWRLYRGRADCENLIKELKYDFAAGSLCLNDFWATEASLNTVMMAFNLMSLFRRVLLKSMPNHTLKTLRYKLFAMAGYLTHESRKSIIKIAVAMKRRAWIQGLWEQAAQFDQHVYFSPAFTPPDT